MIGSGPIRPLCGVSGRTHGSSGHGSYGVTRPSPVPVSALLCTTLPHLSSALAWTRRLPTTTFLRGLVATHPRHVPGSLVSGPVSGRLFSCGLTLSYLSTPVLAAFPIVITCTDTL